MISPVLNCRADEFGGNLENRARFPLAILDAIRARVGRDLLVEYRHWLAGTVMSVGFVGLFIRQEVARKRRLRRMARECRHESGQEG